MSVASPATPARSGRSLRSSPKFGGSQSAPNLGKDLLHHRGEHGFGTVRGYEHHFDEKYVPRAMWTVTEGSTLKKPDFSAEQFCEDGRQADMQKTYMQQHVRSVLDKQMKEKEGVHKQRKDEVQDMMRATDIDLSRKIKEDTMEKEGAHAIKKAFKAGLDEQVAKNARKAYENRLSEAYEGAEVKVRVTQQLCQELSEANRKKEVVKKDMQEQLREKEAKKLQQRAEKDFEVATVRQNMRNQLKQDIGCWEASLQRINAAKEQQEANYSHYANTTGHVEGAKRAREDKMLDRQEKHHQTRTDMHYAQREMGRVRQQQRVVQELEQQVAQKEKQKDTKVIQQDFERSQVMAATRMAMEGDLMKFHQKRTEELDHQAALIAQMHDKQRRQKDEHPDGRLGHSRRPASMKIMDVTPGLIGVAEAWHAGSSSQQIAPGDHMQRMDASKHLSKPCGRAEEEKPWVDIVKSHGPGGVVGIWGSDGPTKSKLMATGGPKRMLAKSLELANKEKAWSGPWHEGMSAADRKAGREAAARRREAAAADKAIA